MAPVKVTEAQLLSDPTSFHMKLVEVEGWWSHEPDCSKMAGAWFSPPHRMKGKKGRHYIRVVGLWRASGPGAAPPGFGHRGEWRAQLDAYSLVELPVPPRPHV